MIAALPAYEPPAIVQPAPLIEVRRRRRGGSRDPDIRRSGLPTWVYVGAVLLLTGDDGSERTCHVIHVDHDRGLYYCAEDQ